MTKREASALHMKWLVKNRSKNQSLSLRLFMLMKSYEGVIKNDEELLNISQGLVASLFSLWRAVFLSDVKNANEHLFSDAMSFLSKLICDNAINYPQDMASKEWTFIYYLNNARYRLEKINNQYPNYFNLDLELDVSDNKTLKQDWCSYHLAVKKAINDLHAILSDRDS